LRQVAEAGEHASTTSPLSAFERDGIAFAWCEYTWDSKDTKRPEAPRRPARGRTLIAANEWVQALLTACFWDADRAAGESAWELVVASLRLAGRWPLGSEESARGDA
jgi:hypothetical protein